MSKLDSNTLLISLAGNILMIAVRMLYVKNLYYGFLAWNLFLAGLPLLISSKLFRIQHLRRLYLFSGLLIWILFLPNAPYIITDLVHLHHRPPVPYWYDMLLILLSAFNGLALGFVSINQIEKLIFRRNAEIFLLPFRIGVMIAMGYGVYMGRYLRFNSWDAFLNPVEVFKGVTSSVHVATIGFVLTFSFVTFLLYAFFQSILLRRSQEVF